MTRIRRLKRFLVPFFLGALVVLSGGIASQGGDANFCYAVADSENQLVKIHRTTGVNTTIGDTVAGNIEGIAFNLGGSLLYASDEDRLGTLSLSTGAFSPVGFYGTGNGSLGVVTFNLVDALTFDPLTGILYGSHKEGGNAGPDLLFQINPATGSRVADAFGAGVDYVVAIPSPPPAPFENTIDAIAIDPADGQMYAINNNDGHDQDRLIKINKADGARTDVGPVGVEDMGGLSFANDGTLYGTTAKGSPPPDEDRLWTLNKSTGAATVAHSFTSFRDYESVDCLSADANTVVGTVWQDDNQNQVIDGAEAGTTGVTVRLYTDANNDGAVDAGDTLIQSKDSAVGGGYSFTLGAGGNFVLEIDQADLPAGSTMTEPPPPNSYHQADFVGFGNSDGGNNFGFNADDPPTATDDSATTPQNTAVTIPVLANDTDPDGNIDTGSVTVTVAPSNGGTAVEPGGAITYTPDAAFLGPDTFTYQVCDFSGLCDTAVVSVTVAPEADLSIAKSGSPDPVMAGEDLTYTVTVTNNGPSDSLSFTVTDPIPSSTSVVDDGACTNDGTNITCSNSTTVVPSGSVSFTIVVAVDPATPDAATISNTASITAADPTDPDPVNDSATTITAVDTVANLSVTKTDSPDPVNAGESVTYTITVTNSGPSNSDATTVDDVLPATSPPNGFTVGSVSSSQGGCTALPCNLGTIAPGASATVTLVADVDQAVDPGVYTNSASASNEEGSVVSDTEDTTVTGLSGLAVTKTDAPDPVNAGEAVTYTITVTNLGPSVARNTTVDDSLPVTVPPGGFTIQSVSSSKGACTSLPCNLGTIPKDQSETVTVVVDVGPGVTPGAYHDTATADADESSPVSDGEDTEVAEMSNLTIDKTDSPDPVVAGAQVTYTITVGNTGPSNADNITVDDTLPAGFSTSSVSSSQGGCSALPCNLGTLVPGATATVTLVADVDPATPAGTYTDNATADADESAPVSDGETTTVSELSNLIIAKSDSPGSVVAGTQVTYTVLVGNTGPSIADNVTVTDVLPAGFTVAGVSSSQGGCGALPCNLGTIVPGDSATVTITADVDQTVAAGTYTDTATADADESSAVSDDEDTDVTEMSSITIDKTDSPDPVVAGAQVTYTITVGNNGPSIADNVTVDDVLPAGFTVASVSSSQGGCVALPCNLGSIPVSATATVTIVVDADPSLDAGPLTNSAFAIADESTSVSVDEETEVIQRADLSIDKVDDPDPVAAGGLLTYTITASNLGPSDARDIEMTDTLPSETTFDSASVDCALSGSDVVCTAALIPAGGSVSWTITVVVDKVGPTVSDGTIIDNEAEVTSDTADPDSSSNRVTESTTISAPELVLVKSAVPPSGSDVSPGEDITYTITYVNGGSGAANDVVLSDVVSVLLGEVTPDTSGVFDPSTRIITWTIGFVPPGGSGTVSFTARVGAASSAQTIKNRAEAIAVELSTPSTSNQTSHNLQLPDVLVTKTADRPENSEIKAFDIVTYRIEVRNRGAGNALGVIVTDDPPPHMNYVPGSTRVDGGGIADSGGTSPLFGGGVSLGTLAPGQTKIVTFRMTVAVSAPAGALIENWGYATWNLGTLTTGDFIDLRILRPRVGPTLRQSILVQAPSGRTIFVTVVNEFLELLPVTGVQSVMLALLGLSALGFGRAASMRISSDPLRRETIE